MAVVPVKRKVGRPPKNEVKQIKDLNIDLSKWLFLNPNSYGVRIAANELGLVLGKKKTSDSNANICRLKMGNELAAQLGINVGDTICFYSNPDDLLSIAAVKRPNGNKDGRNYLLENV